MAKGLKMLVIGALFGLLAVFAFIGVKSMLNDQQMVTQDNGFVAIPPEGSVEGASTATSNDAAAQASSQDESVAGTDEGLSDVTLVDEEDSDTVDSRASTNTGTRSSENANISAPDMDDPDQFELVEEYGQLNLSLHDPDNNNVEGEFVIFDQEGLQVAASSGGSEASFDLSPGKYRIAVSANGKRTERNLGVYKDKMTNARFELPSTANANNGNNNTATTQTAAEEKPPVAKGQLLVYVRAAENNTPLKSNIYVQTSNGQHVAKANYNESADFLLTAGTYKITVKARDRQDVVKTVQVGAGASLRETFSLQSSIASNNTGNTGTQAQNQTQAQAPARQEGTLKMQLQTGEGLPQRARFTIRESAGGVRLADLGPASTAELQLPSGAYAVEIDFGRQQNEGDRPVRRIDIAAGKTSLVTFDAADFVERSNVRPARPVNRPSSNNQNSSQTTPQARGVLQLNAVSGIDSSPLAVNFTVSARDGRVLKRLNNVSSAEINVPVGDVQVLINYKEMSGSEIINIKANEPTVYTFTISPQSSQMFQQQPSSPEQQLTNQIQQEITRRLQ